MRDSDEENPIDEQYFSPVDSTVRKRFESKQRPLIPSSSSDSPSPTVQKTVQKTNRIDTGKFCSTMSNNEMDEKTKDFFKKLIKGSEVSTAQQGE
jgi:hypothetical protein